MNLIIARRMIALAALLAATVMAAWDLRSTNSSSETLTVYQDAPALHLLDHGPPGNSPGDVHHFFAPLHSSPASNHCWRSLTEIRLVTPSIPTGAFFLPQADALRKVCRHGA